MLELKVCPFCGSPGRIVQTNIYVDDNRVAFVEEYRAECPQCGGNTGRVYKSRFVRKDGEIRFERDGYTAAVDGWNRRAAVLPGVSIPGEEESEEGEHHD